LTILIRFAKLAYADWSHTDNTSAAEAKLGSKGIEENHIIANWEPETECYDERLGESDNHGVEAPNVVRNVA
jgi:hypothetical protein